LVDAATDEAAATGEEPADEAPDEAADEGIAVVEEVALEAAAVVEGLAVEGLAVEGVVVVNRDVAVTRSWVRTWAAGPASRR
jgi:hypothetical protein